MLTQNQLIKICPMPARRAAELLSNLIAAMQEFKITTRTRAAAFLSQCGHESLDFSVWTENLNYSAKRLLEIFPKYFNVSTANTYARNPKMIANRVYANRMGNGNERSGDGWKFRGRNPIQATGKDMYEYLSEVLGLDLINNPDLLLEPKNGLRAAAAIFAVKKRCNALADQLTGDGGAVDLARFDRITKTINGGTNGTADRRARYKRALDVLSGDFSLEQSSPNTAITPAENNTPDNTSDAQSTAQSTSVKDFTKKYLVHTPTDKVRNVLFVVFARITSLATFLWNLGFHGRALLFLICFAAIVPVVVAVVYYRARIWNWGTQIFEGFFGE